MENIKRESIKRYQFTFGVPVFETKLGLSHDMKENMSNYLSNCHDVQKHRTNVKAIILYTNKMMILKIYLILFLNILVK